MTETEEERLAREIRERQERLKEIKTIRTPAEARALAASDPDTFNAAYDSGQITPAALGAKTEG